MSARTTTQEKEVKIPLDPQLTARENSQKYFDKYGKLKRDFRGSEPAH
ncbi:MAG: NFACT family protein [Clostridium fessum]